MLIWKRYTLTKFWLSLLALLVLAFFFYASVHHSLHTIKGGFTASPLKLAIFYYLAQISLKAEFLVPQLVAIASTITLFSMQNRREVLFLRASGLSLKALTLPLIYSSLLITFVLYANFQWLHPICEKISAKKERLEKGTVHERHKSPALYLKDQTILLYSSIDQKSHSLLYAFWIKDPETIYSIEQLDCSDSTLPIGINVLCFTEQDDGDITLTKAFDIKEFPEIEFSFYDNPFSKIFTAGGKNRMTELFRAIPWNDTGVGTSVQIPQRILALMSSFYYMLISPLASLFGMILSAYFCLKFSRIPKSTLAYVVPLSALNFFFILLKAGIVLANNSVLPVFHMMFIPLLTLVFLTSFVFAKL